jgi:uncharacterized membrane protein
MRGLVWGLLMLSGLAVAQPRLEPEERERLRHELREQAREERLRHREPARERRLAHEAGLGQSHEPSGDPGTPRRAIGSPYAPVWHDHHSGEAPHDGERRRRMSPEQRDELRMMLRERRRSRD